MNKRQRMIRQKKYPKPKIVVKVENRINWKNLGNKDNYEVIYIIRIEWIHAWIHRYQTQQE